MEAIEYIRRQIAVAWRVSDGVIADLTDDLLNWSPPGKANTISATLAHILGGEDKFVQGFVQGKPTIWDTQNWGEKIGVNVTPGPGANWDDYKGQALSVDSFRAYREAVRVGTRSYLENLSDADLERNVAFPGGDRSVAEMMMLLVIHIVEHSGEVAALKGIQGSKGLPM